MNADYDEDDNEDDDDRILILSEEGWDLVHRYLEQCSKQFSKEAKR